jgi:2-(1,2-epoxy-1,2-dihydrophenyl)acetyl-CoA isomerase
MTDEAVLSAVKGSVLTLTLNRPDIGNALRSDDCAALREEILAVDGGDGIRAIVIRAEGRHFCTGADLVSANAGQGKPHIGHMSRGLQTGAHGLISAIWKCPVPTVSLVHGKAIGLGLHLAVVCDFTIADRDASFAEVFCKRGFSVDSGGSFLLPRLIGLRKTRQMLMRGITVDAETAAQWGLIDDVVTPETLDRTGADLAAELASGPTYSLGHTKALLNQPSLAGMDSTLYLEAQSVEATIRSSDFKEGIRAFAERRDPVFTGS